MHELSITRLQKVLFQFSLLPLRHLSQSCGLEKWNISFDLAVEVGRKMICLNTKR